MENVTEIDKCRAWVLEHYAKNNVPFYRAGFERECPYPENKIYRSMMMSKLYSQRWIKKSENAFLDTKRGKIWYEVDLDNIPVSEIVRLRLVYERLQSEL